MTDLGIVALAEPFCAVSHFLSNRLKRDMFEHKFPIAVSGRCIEIEDDLPLYNSQWNCGPWPVRTLFQFLGCFLQLFQGDPINVGQKFQCPKTHQINKRIYASIWIAAVIIANIFWREEAEIIPSS